MIRRSQVSWLVIILLAVCCAPLGYSQSVQLTLNNGGNDTMDGVYVGPYNFTETPLPGGTPHSAQLICDDFKDDVYAGESWTANVTSFSNLNSASGLMFQNQANWQQGYEAMAYLATQMLGTTNSTTIGYLAYAIWAVFEPTAVQNWLSAHHDSGSWNTILNDVNTALAAVKNLSPSYFSGWEILTPTSCNSQTCPPQEYLQYVPEGGTTLAYLLLAGVACLGAMLFRSRRQISVTR